MTTCWFTSDLHFGHVNIARYCGRPFISLADEVDTDAMNQAIIENWNDVIAPDDEVWVLGDVCLGKIKETLPLCALLHGDKHLIPGNHDRIWPHTKKHEQWVEAYEAVGFQIEPLITRLYTNQGTVTLAHLPYEGDSHDEDRWVDDRPQPWPVGGTKWLIHGHVHDKWRQNGYQINVGIDAWGGSPVSLEQILSLIQGGRRHLEAIPWSGRG